MTHRSAARPTTRPALRRRRLSTVAGVLTVLALTVAGCTGSSSDGGSDGGSGGGAGGGSDAAKAGPRYVALGDSFTAGPGINPTDADSGQCARSTRNYPTLLSTALDVASFDDVSCSGATTDDITQPNVLGDGTTVPAQLDAVDEKTTLVTIGIGGNDGDLFTTLALTCTRSAAACSDYLTDQLPGVLASTRTKVASTIAAVRVKAPEARVVLVGYLGVVAAGQTCDALGGSVLDTTGVAGGEDSIDAMLAGAAEDSSVTYVSMSKLSAGHDACAGDDEAWTNGISTELGQGIALHPRVAGMEAVATAVEKGLDQPSSGGAAG